MAGHVELYLCFYLYPPIQNLIELYRLVHNLIFTHFKLADIHVISMTE